MSELQPVFQDFLTTLITGILALLSAFLIALAKKGFDWLTVKIEGVKNTNERNQLNEAMSILDNLVVNTVTALQQTLGDEIRKSIKLNDGKYTREDLLELKNTAIEAIKEQLSNQTFDLLSGNYGDVDALIGDMVETYVRKLKASEIDLQSSRALLG